MKKRAQKKLVLAKETLVNLEDRQLAAPRGGSLWTYCSFACPTSGGGLCDHDCGSEKTCAC